MFRRGDQDTDSSDSEAEAVKPAASDTTPPEKDEDQASDDEGGLFGNMLELPAGESTQVEDPKEVSRIVTLREFPLPKHLPSAFALPKKLLSDLILSRKAMAPSRSAEASEPKLVVTTLEYKELSRNRRNKRCRLDIVFTPENRSINKGNKHLSIDRRNVQSQGTSTAGTPLLQSGQATPVSVDATSDQLSRLGKEVDAIRLSESQPESNASADKPNGQTAATPPPPTFLDDFSYMIQMESVGCPTVSEAENYVALVALHELTTSTHHSTMTTTKSASLGLSSMTSPSSVALRMEYPPINARHLPVPYRDMWDELEAIRKLQEDKDSRRLWKGLDEVLQSQMATVAGTEKITAPGSEVSRKGSEKRRQCAEHIHHPSFFPGFPRLCIPVKDPGQQETQSRTSDKGGGIRSAHTGRMAKTVSVRRVSENAGKSSCSDSKRLAHVVLLLTGTKTIVTYF